MPPGLSCSTVRVSSASAANPAIRPATRSDQEKNHKEVKTYRISRSSSSHSEYQRNHLSISQDQINADHQGFNQEELLQGLILQEWCQRDLQGYSADQIKSAIRKRLLFPSVVSPSKIWIIAQGASPKADSVPRDSSKSSQGMTSMLQPRNQQPSSSFFSWVRLISGKLLCPT